MGKEENAIMRQCMEILGLYGLVYLKKASDVVAEGEREHRCGVYWRQNTGAAWFGEGNKKRPVFYGVPGQADIAGILGDGTRFHIETKTPTGRQSDTQKAYEKIVTGFGENYIIVRDVAELQAWLDTPLGE